MAHSYDSFDEAHEAAELMEISAEVTRDHDTGLWGWMDDDEGPVIHGQIIEPEAPKSTALVPFVRPVPTVDPAKSGATLSLRVANLPESEARELAAKLGKMGFQVDLLNSVGRTVGTVEAAPKAVRKPMNKPATENQRKIIEICTRPKGANTHELFAAGCAPGGKFNAIGWSGIVEACERFGYKMRKTAEIVNNKAIIRYYLDAIAPSADAEYQMAAD